MEEEDDFDGGVVVGQLPTVRVPRHIKKRSLRNKALSVGFNDKDLRDFVTGFHKRKKKRRKEAERQLQEKVRLKRIQARKKRKQEKEFAMYGAATLEDPQVLGSLPGEPGSEADEPNLHATVCGTKLYENDDTTILVTTTELSPEDDKPRPVYTVPEQSSRVENKCSLLVKKKPLKKVVKHKSRRKAKKTASKRDKRKSRNKQ